MDTNVSNKAWTAEQETTMLLLAVAEIVRCFPTLHAHNSRPKRGTCAALRWPLRPDLTSVTTGSDEHVEALPRREENSVHTY